MQYRTSLMLLFCLLFSAFYARAESVSDANFNTDHFSGSGNCASCHDGMTADDGAEVSFRKAWSATMMANSARDPFWRAKMASELARHPELADQINDKCLRCHAPMASMESELQASTLEAFGDGVFDASHPLHDAAMDGVSCTACHQLQPGEVEQTHSGQFSIDPDSAVAFGPRTNPRRNPMANSSGFTPTHGAHMSDSSVCASCHTLKTPFVDGDGVVASTTPDREFPEQMPYLEWENSDFGPGGSREQSCQSCHMPRRDGVALSRRPRSLAKRDNVAEHGFLGANTLMLEILDRHAIELGVPAADFEGSIADSRRFLREGVALELLSASIDNGNLDLAVQVINHSGHKFPTGFPSRRAYLHLTVTDAAGNMVFESGHSNPDGSVVGIAADDNLTNYEAHYQTITREDQVQVYEPVMGDTDGKVTYSLLRAANYLKDNRILPAGFDKSQVPDDIAVQGDAGSDADFVGGSDTVHYRLPVAASGALTIRLALNYQPIGFAFLQDLLSSGNDTVITRFGDYFEQASNKTETVSELEVVIDPLSADNQSVITPPSSGDQPVIATDTGSAPRSGMGRMRRR